jgi:hypothetical protein
MRLHQLKIDFAAEQDRLLMLIAASEQVEVRMWLTRRFVKLLWPLLVKLAEEASPRIRTQPNPEARKALLNIEHEQAVSKANFSKPYDDSTRATPLGAEPCCSPHPDRTIRTAPRWWRCIPPKGRA